MQGTRGTLEDGHQGWLADCSHPSACNRAGSPNPNSWRQSQRVPRPPWSLWVSGQRVGGGWAGVAGAGGGCGSEVQGQGVQGELCHVPIAALAHALLFLRLFCLSPSSALAAACCRSALLSGPLSPCPHVPCPHVLMSLCPLCPCVPMSLYSHAHLPLCLPVPMSHVPVLACPLTCLSDLVFVPHSLSSHIPCV